MRQQLYCSRLRDQPQLITRLLPRGTSFEGRVHEQVASSLPRVRIDLQLGHDGYRDVQIAAKRGRNQALLIAELADQPDDPYLLYQLGKDAEMRGDLPAACAYFSDALHTRCTTPIGAMNW